MRAHFCTLTIHPARSLPCYCILCLSPLHPSFQAASLQAARRCGWGAEGRLTLALLNALPAHAHDRCGGAFKGLQALATAVPRAIMRFRPPTPEKCDCSTNWTLTQ